MHTQANDGVCDEGRGLGKDPRRPAYERVEVHCDLGTDCADCGEWEGALLGDG